MLYSHVYNDGMTRDLINAYRERNTTYLESEIKKSAQQIIALTIDSEEYQCVSERLHICLALHNALAFGGETVSLMMDFINL